MGWNGRILHTLHRLMGSSAEGVLFVLVEANTDPDHNGVATRLSALPGALGSLAAFEASREMQLRHLFISHCR